MNRITFFTTLLVFGALGAVAATAGDANGKAEKPPESPRATVPEERFDRLRRGINTSHWFAQVYDDSGYSPEHFQRFITEEDLALIAALGFGHIRFSVDPEPFFDLEHPGELKRDYLQSIDEAIEMILAHDLAVIFDLHPGPQFKRPLRDDDDYLAAVAAFWESLARRLSRYDPNRLFLEPLNESEIHDPARWQHVQEILVAAVRRGAPRHTIIATCYKWSGLDDLLVLEPVKDPNVVYAFHYYDPGMFTHQGATWAWPPWANVADVPYPSDPESVAPLLGEIEDEETRRALAYYGEQRWNAARIGRDIAKAAAWASKHGVRITSNEFGVYSEFSPPDDRARYLEDVRRAFERHNVAWTMWDYAGKFGLMKREGGRRVPDSAVIEALGLRSPSRL